MNYKNKYFLITGAYRGIGKSIAIYFAKKHANLVLTYHLNKELTWELGKKLAKEYQINVEILPLDLKKEESIQELYQSLSQKKIIIDYLINNAALSRDNDYLSKTKEEFMDVLETNVVGTFLMIQYFDKQFCGKNIFNISSTDGIDTGSIYSVDYNASKAAINIMGKTLSMISPNNIITICPNWVNTESTLQINKDYLKSEMQRIHQKNLISVNKIPILIDQCIQKKVKSGSIIKIEDDNDGRIN